MNRQRCKWWICKHSWKRGRNSSQRKLLSWNRKKPSFRIRSDRPSW